MGVLASLKSLDSFGHQKLDQDFVKRTLAGSFITVIAACLMAFLFLNELRACWAPEGSLVQSACAGLTCCLARRHIPHAASAAPSERGHLARRYNRGRGARLCCGCELHTRSAQLTTAAALSL